MDEISISPNYTTSKLTSGAIEDKIDVFEDQLKGWTLNHAYFLTDPKNPSGNHNAGFAILMLCSAYFETIESCYQGRASGYGESKKFFRAGFLRVFPDLPEKARPLLSSPESEIEKLVDAVYDEVRCGLYHRMATKSRGVISRTKMPATFALHDGSLSALVLDPWAFLEAIGHHLVTFLAELRHPANSDLRTAFVAFFDKKQSGPGATLPPNFFGSAKSTYP